MKKIKILLIIILFTLTGCLNYTEINDIGIINSIGITKDNNNYIVSINMLIPKENDLKNKVTYTVKSINLDNAFDKLYLTSTKKINLSHLELLILSNELDKNDYDSIIDFFINRSDSRNTFEVVLLNNYNDTTIKEYSEEEITSLIESNQNEDGIVSKLTFDELVKDILNNSISYIPIIEIKDNIKVLGYSSVYKYNKLLSEKESLAYNYITNKINKCNLVINDTYIKVDNSNTLINTNKNNITITINSNINNNNKDKYIKILKEYINYFTNNNDLEYFNNLIKKHDYNYYKNNKNIDINFKTNVIVGEYNE